MNFLTNLTMSHFCSVAPMLRGVSHPHTYPQLLWISGLPKTGATAGRNGFSRPPFLRGQTSPATLRALFPSRAPRGVAAMKSGIHPEYKADHGDLQLRQHLPDPLDARSRPADRGVLELPSVLYRQAEDRRHGRSRRQVPQEVRPLKPARFSRRRMQRGATAPLFLSLPLRDPGGPWAH